MNAILQVLNELTAELIWVDIPLSKTYRINAVDDDDDDESFLSDELLLLRLANDKVSLPPSNPKGPEYTP